MRSTMNRRCFPAVLVLTLAACVSTQAVRLGAGDIRPPVPPDRVALYRTAEQVPRKYEEVALLSTKGDYESTNEAMYNSMRKQAGKLGANGIILESISKEHGAGAKVAVNLLAVIAAYGNPNGSPASGPDRKGKAIAIYIFQDSAAKH